MPGPAARLGRVGIARLLATILAGLNQASSDEIDTQELSAPVDELWG